MFHLDMYPEGVVPERSTRSTGHVFPPPDTGLPPYCLSTRLPTDTRLGRCQYHPIGLGSVPLPLSSFPRWTEQLLADQASPEVQRKREEEGGRRTAAVVTHALGEAGERVKTHKTRAVQELRVDTLPRQILRPSPRSSSYRTQ
jgi:hypothetical protein